MADLQQKRIVLGVTGGIAAYKAAELLRLLIKDGADVQVVMTQAACGFITPATMQALSGKPVYTDMWDARAPDNMAHISLTRAADMIVVAPASADFLAKLAQGFADDLLSTLCLARSRGGCRLAVAPAMNREMWDNPATQRNVAQLARDGISILGPASGAQACGEVGAGRMLEASEIHAELCALVEPRLFDGTRILITAGPTFEPIDAVRGITNRSSGKMGYAIARAALAAGAEVTLISGPTALDPPAAACIERVETAAEMYSAVQKHVERADIFISVAAVADYRVDAPRKNKIKKSEDTLTLKLLPNPDILSWVAARPRPPFCVGFAAETDNLVQYAEEKRRRKKIPLLVANLAHEALGADDNELTLLDDDGIHVLPRAAKTALARSLIAYIAARYRATQKS